MRLDFEGIVGVQPRKSGAVRAQGSGSAEQGQGRGEGKLGRAGMFSQETGDHACASDRPGFKF